MLNQLLHTQLLHSKLKLGAEWNGRASAGAARSVAGMGVPQCSGRASAGAARSVAGMGVPQCSGRASAGAERSGRHWGDHREPL